MTMLSFDELWSKLLEGDESVEIEAKRGEQVGGSIHETISAFSNEPNRNGGYLLLGVEASEGTLFPDYRIVGVPDPNKIQADLATQCSNVFNSNVRPQIFVEQREGKTVLVVYIAEVQPQEKPVYILSKGLPRGAFRRIGSTDQHCTDDDIELFYQARGGKAFDETLVEDTTLDDFDPAAVREYRRLRAEVNPNAAELRFDDAELLYSLSAVGGERGKPCATVAGLMLFGKQMTLRRHFPMTRVDYIRIPGREWVPDPANRYQALETREPLLLAIPRIINQVLDDVLKGFSLPGDSIYRRDVPLIPRDVIREAVVNSLMHRSYRIQTTLQIRRYSNRLEIENPGSSLVPDERLGEPGSMPRNQRIAAVLHDLNIAETKGTGIRTMREAMAQANLTPPFFASDRQRDLFTVRLLTHHFFSPEDVKLLESFSDCNLSDDEARSLIAMREVGAINNAAYRDLNRVDTLNASGHLRRLRDLELLEAKGRGAATYYVPGARFIAAEQGAAASQVSASNPTGKALPVRSNPTGKKEPTKFPGLPPHLAEAVENLGKRTTLDEVRYVVLKLCGWRALQVSELAAILNRSRGWVQETYLRPLVRSGELEYTYPDNPAHPQQAYRTAKKGNKA